MFAFSKVNKTMIAVERARIAVDCIINVKEWTGVHRFTSGVSPIR